MPMRLIKSVLAIGALFAVCTISAQDNLPMNMDTNRYSGAFSANGFLDYGSSTLSSEFLNVLLGGGTIDNEMKNRVFARQEDRNLFGVAYAGELEYRNYKVNLFGKERVGYLVRAGNYVYTSAYYPKDAFGLILYGNDLYRGDSATLSPTEFNSVQFSKVGWGIVDKVTKSSASINLYSIGAYQDLYLRNAKLKVSEDADQLDLDITGQFSFANNTGFSQGFGAGFDFDYRLPVTWFNNEQVWFSCQAKNIGVMSIGKVQTYLADSLYSFDGFTFEQLFQADSSFSIDQISDSLELVEGERRVTTLLPGFIQMGKIVHSQASKKLQSFFGVRMYTTLNYNPMAYFGLQYKIADEFAAAVQSSYGGFARFRTGFYFSYAAPKLKLAMGCEDLIGTLYPQGSGSNINLRILYRW